MRYIRTYDVINAKQVASFELEVISAILWNFLRDWLTWFLNLKLYWL